MSDEHERPRPTMVDPQLEATLSEKGWVVVPLLDDDQVQRLRDFYYSRVAEGGINPEGAHNPTYAEFSVIHSTPEFRSSAFDEIEAVVGRAATPMLRSYRSLVANYVNKQPDLGVVPMHQNWSVVDEERYRSISVWVALVDCTDDNGALELLAGSHLDLRLPRGMWAYEAFSHIEDRIHPMLERVRVRAGEAIILDDAVVHYSPPNLSDRDRLAIQLIMVPEEASPRFFQQVDSDEHGIDVDVWEVSEPFFFDFWHGDGDARYGRVVERVRLPDARTVAAEFAEKYRPTSA